VKKRQSSSGSWLVAVVVVLAVIAAGVLIWRKAVQTGTEAPAPSATAPVASTTAASPAEPAIQHPISQAEAGPAEASSAPLPALEASDDSVAKALMGLAGAGDLRGLLFTDQVIPRIVATVDALPRESVATRILPVRAPRGAFLTEQQDGRTLTSDRNAERYAPYMRIVESADPQALVAWYVRNYPLFQQAYRDLGYPKAYFNDRLIVAIDDMLAAPDLSAPAELVQPKVFYLYADPGLQSLSAGQKLMLRVGPANEAKIKARLRTIRAALVGAKLQPATAPAIH